MFLGVTADVASWNADGTAFSLLLYDNPLIGESVAFLREREKKNRAPFSVDRERDSLSGGSGRFLFPIRQH